MPHNDCRPIMCGAGRRAEKTRKNWTKHEREALNGLGGCAGPFGGAQLGLVELTSVALDDGTESLTVD
jgi:hypothetical protein